MPANTGWNMMMMMRMIIVMLVMVMIKMAFASCIVHLDASQYWVKL